MLESDLLGEGGEQVLVLLEGVRMYEADGDRSVALFVKLEQVSSRLLDVWRYISRSMKEVPGEMQQVKTF